jgi:hypothetical protein
MLGRSRAGAESGKAVARAAAQAGRIVARGVEKMANRVGSWPGRAPLGANKGGGGADRVGGTGTWRPGRGWMYAGEASMWRLVNRRRAGGSTAEVGEQTESCEVRLWVGAWGKLTDHCKAVRVRVLKAVWVGQSRC